MPRSGLHLAKPETVLFEAIDNAGRNRINVRLAGCAIADTLKPLKFGAHTNIPAEVVFHANPEVEAISRRLVTHFNGTAQERTRGVIQSPAEDSDPTQCTELWGYRPGSNDVDAESAYLVPSGSRKGRATPERSTRRHRELAEVDVTGFKPHIFIELVAAGQFGASTRTFIVAGEARKISIQS